MNVGVHSYVNFLSIVKNFKCTCVCKTRRINILFWIQMSECIEDNGKFFLFMSM